MNETTPTPPPSEQPGTTVSSFVAAPVPIPNEQPVAKASSDGPLVKLLIALPFLLPIAAYIAASLANPSGWMSWDVMGFLMLPLMIIPSGDTLLIGAAGRVFVPLLIVAFIYFHEKGRKAISRSLGLFLLVIWSACIYQSVSTANDSEFAG